MTLSTKCRLERVFQMPNSRTFTIPVVKKLIFHEMVRGVICDPFPFEGDLEALSYMETYASESVSFGLYDPPYSQYQLFEMYKGLGQNLQSNAAYFKKVDAEWDRIIAPEGKIIKFGWNSKRISKNFAITRILLINHGGAHHDTICTVQQKIQERLQ